ncbi:unnamed protein product [Spirodela intermedia]|uniref:Phosphatidic acid phosphatase type 2/haloperoxidase domain-containing protein n=1 Tax=Spirodela intermedia TaxID=51605 RepID=A0A7I8IMR2_SPIIN|nr:unnamed protein product [Spirodela intermedia]CAA6659060.1 unnamed protein product [Spirodela intermedia]
MKSGGDGEGAFFGVPGWQGLSLCAIMGWILLSSALGLTQKIRSLVQPWVSRRVASETPLVLFIQSADHVLLDTFFSVLSCIVSVPFYTGFLPLLFWSEHGKLARQMTLLMAFCDYVGNAMKDLVSAPRPSSPPVRRITATKDEKENAMEYGLPSSHALNTVCLSGFLLHYMIANGLQKDASNVIYIGISLVFLLVALIGLGRIYLGMHSFIDVLGGIGLGITILSFWINVYGYVDDFIISGQNVTSFWAGLSLLLLFAYPTSELPTPSFEYHTAFTGVAFGIVSGVQQSSLHLSYGGAPRMLPSELTPSILLGRLLLGLPIILVVKFCSKALAKWSLPILCNALGIPIRSSCYVPGLKAPGSNEKPESKQLSSLHKISALSPQEPFDVDTGIRFLQYAGLGWSVVDLVPSLFAHLRL